MASIRYGFAAIAALGLMATPAMAETRSAQALPAPSAQVDSSSLALASAPIEGSESLGRRGFSPAYLLALLAIIAAIIAAAGGGGGGGNDSPG